MAIVDVVEEFTRALDAVCDTDPALLADGDSLVALHRQIERLEAVVTRVGACFDAGGSWEADGARTAASWLATRCRLPLAAAQRRVHLGRDLRHMPVVDKAWLAGDIGVAQVTQLAAAHTPATAEAFDRDEADLVDHARRLGYRKFVRVLSYWRHRADADGVEDEASAQREGRRLHLSQSFEGIWFLDGVSTRSREPSWSRR